MTDVPRATIRADFDRLAAFDTEGWSHNNHYHPYLLRHLPPRLGASLDIGCGSGTFSRLLAARSDRVLGIDLSPEMIRLARRRSAQHPNIEYRVADVLELDLGEAAFDCIASIATLHHLPFAETMARLARALRPGVVLLILDLFQGEGPADWARSAVAFPVQRLLHLVHTGRLSEPEAARAAWDEHGQHDHYLPVSRIRRACAEILPGAILRKHLLWRYSLVWKRGS